MISRLFRFVLKAGVVGSVVAVAAKVLDRRRSAPSDWSASTEPWPPVPPSAGEPTPASTPAATPAATEEDGPAPVDDATQGWSDPDGDGSCPTSHPVKAKLSSKVFHLPGMANYERTKADRCYADAGAARADGLRQAKR